MQVMNDRLLNNPIPPTVLDASISPQLQEMIYRALERDPQEPLRTRPASSRTTWPTWTKWAWRSGRS